MEDFFDDLVEEHAGRVSYPTLKIFVRKYLKPLEGNDKKALSIFKLQETKEAARRLEVELVSIKNHEASNAYLKELIGDKKFKKHRGFENWAATLLLMLPTIRDY